MDPILGGLLLGGGMGLLKHVGNVAGNENDRKVSSAVAKWSPWTGQAVPKVRKANFAESMVPSVLGGLAMGQKLGADSGGGLGSTMAASPNKYSLGVDMSMPTLSPWPYMAGSY